MRDEEILEELGLLTDGGPRIDAPIPAMTYRAMSAVGRFFDTTVFGAANVPETGPALLVGNHALLGIDSWAFMPSLLDATGRYPRALMLRSLFDAPYLGPILRELGAQPGTRESAHELLSDGNLVVVYPGGARDSMKGRHQKYELRWGDRCGFAAVAIASQCPVIPVAGIGPDEVFPVLSKRGFVKMDWLGKDPVPLFLPLARRLPFRFHLGEAIMPPTLDEDNPDQAIEFAMKVRDELTTLIDSHKNDGRRQSRRQKLRRLLRRD